MLFNVSKTNQIKVISIFLIILNIVFFLVPLEMQWNDVDGKYLPTFIYQYTVSLIIHLIFLLCLLFNFFIKSRIVYRVTAFVLVTITFLYFISAIMHNDSKSWYAVGLPYLSIFLPLILYRIYLIKKLKE